MSDFSILAQPIRCLEFPQHHRITTTYNVRTARDTAQNSHLLDKVLRRKLSIRKPTLLACYYYEY
jgi:hypothetical protein